MGSIYEKKSRNFNSLPLSEMFLLLLLGFYFSFSKWKPERVHSPPPRAPTPFLDVIPTPCLRRITVFLCACACVRAGCKRMCRFGTVLGGGREERENRVRIAFRSWSFNLIKVLFFPYKNISLFFH